jgi:para-aminobenzoate synthetase/4-amino-4-deoxychorismate lyase
LNLDENKSYKLKLIQTKWGEIKCKYEVYEPFKGKIKIIISDHQTFSNNPFVYFKTTHRKLYDEEYKHHRSNGYFDVIFMNEKKNITEGTITNIFIVKNNKWITPRLEDGVLNGIYRSHLINENGNVVEQSIQNEDLINADRLYLTNSVRGLIKVDELFIGNKIVSAFS